jgi:hypothetical protein
MALSYNAAEGYAYWISGSGSYSARLDEASLGQCVYRNDEDGKATRI